MKEKKVKEIYWELYEQFKELENKINSQGGNGSKELDAELKEIGELLVKLKKKAKEANIDVDKGEKGDVIMNSEDNWEQIIDCSESDKEIKNVLKKHIISLGKFPSAKQAFDMVEIIDKFYEANVAHPNEVQVSEVYEKKYGKVPEDKKAESLELYQKSAYAAIIDGIKEIGTDWGINPKVDFHVPFNEYFTKNKSIPTTVSELEIPLQCKIDIAEWKWDTTKVFGMFEFFEPKMQISFKFSCFKAAHLLRTTNEEVFGKCVDSYKQVMRNTITLGSFAEGIKPKASTTAISKGIEIKFPELAGSLVLKTDLGSINWKELAKGALEKELSGISLGAIRLQGNFNPLKFDEKYKVVLPEGVTMDRAIISVSIGFNLLCDVPKLSDFVDKKFKKKPKPKTPKPKIKTTSLSKEELKMLEELKQSALDLEKKATNIREIFDDFKKKPQPHDTFKKGVQEFKEHADDLYKKCQKFMGKSTAAKEAGEKLLIETGERVAEIIGKNALKAAAKTALKVVPIIGTVVTIIEIGSLIYSVFSFFSSQDKPWESVVRDWLSQIYNR